ncbi:hypothetical protein COOONC_08275 [Cooperia oncophora]
MIEVDKPGNFYPGGQEQRWRDRELEVLRKVEEDKEKERKEMRKKALNNEDKTKQKTELGVKRPPSTTTDGKGPVARAAPPPPLKAEVRRLPTGEVYAVRELVGYSAGATPKGSPRHGSPFAGSPVVIEEEKAVLNEQRRPCSEEMVRKRTLSVTDGQHTPRPVARAAPPPPLKAEVRRLPTGEVYAVRELVGYSAGATPKGSPRHGSPFAGSPVVIEEEKAVLNEQRRPCSEEMMAIRETGERRDDETDRDGSSMEALDILSEVEADIVEEKKCTSYVGLPSSAAVKGKGPTRKRGSIKLEDKGQSQKVIAYITVE